MTLTKIRIRIGAVVASLFFGLFVYYIVFSADCVRRQMWREHHEYRKILNAAVFKPDAKENPSAIIDEFIHAYNHSDADKFEEISRTTIHFTRWNFYNLKEMRAINGGIGAYVVKSAVYADLKNASFNRAAKLKVQPSDGSIKWLWLIYLIDGDGKYRLLEYEFDCDDENR
ncbi:hypothetical protein JXA32_02110 [Candidatus Sumerlaeota bacterium]|nr:hypothetical protein [Candidatus Sumerlaeota bacterium]